MFGAQMAAVALQGEDLWGLAVRSFFTDNIYGKFDIDLKNLVDGPSEFIPADISSKEDASKLISLLNDFLRFFKDLLTQDGYCINFTVSNFQRGAELALREVLMQFDPEFQDIADAQLLKGCLLWCPSLPQELIAKLRDLVDSMTIIDSFLERHTQVDPATHKVVLKPETIKSVNWATLDFDLIWHRAEVFEELNSEILVKLPKGKHNPLTVSPVTVQWNRHLLSMAAADIRVYRGLARIASLIDKNSGWNKNLISFARLLIVLLQGLSYTSSQDPTLVTQIFEVVDTIMGEVHKIQSEEDLLTKSHFVRIVEGIKNSFTHASAETSSSMIEENIGNQAVIEAGQEMASRKVKLDTLFEKKKSKIMKKLLYKKQGFYDSAEEEIKNTINKLMQSAHSAGEIRCHRTNEVIDQSQVYYMTAQMHVSSAILNQARYRTASQRLEACMQDAQETMDSEMYDKLKGLVNMLGNHEYLGHEQMIITTCGHYLSTDPIPNIVHFGSHSVSDWEIPCDIGKYPSNIKIPIFPAELYQSWLKCDEPKKDNLKLSAVFEALLSSDSPTAFMESATSALRQNSADTKPLIVKYSQELLKFHALLHSYTKTYTAHIQRARTINGGSQPLGLESSVELSFLMGLSEIRSFGSIIKGHAQVYFSLYQIKRMRCIMVFQHEHGTPPTRALENWMQELKSSIHQLKAIVRLLKEGYTEANLVNLPINELYCSLTVKLVGC